MWLLVVIIILLDGYVPSGSLDILKVFNTITAIISTLVLGEQVWMRLDMYPVVLVVIVCEQHGSRRHRYHFHFCTFASLIILL